MIIQPMLTDTSLAPLLNGVCPLPHLGVIQVSGEDAARFLHGQLTQDFSLLGQDEARLAAFCSPKGRMLASFIGFKRPDGAVMLVCSRDLLAPTLRRLSQFVLRAKVALQDVSDAFLLYGLAGNATKTIANYSTLMRPKADFDAESVVALEPVLGMQRQLWLAPLGTPVPSGAALAPALWAWSEVRAGVATLSAAVVEAFVPQMLNYESVGGVNFKKGCYPGQEVVARSQFRGTLKRRAFVAHCAAALQAGQAVFGSEDAEQPIGTVVQAAPAPQGGYEAIVSLQLAFANGAVHLLAHDGPLLALLPLPYTLLQDV